MHLGWEPYSGRKVVCLRDGWNVAQGEHAPVAGRIYTIRSVDPGRRPGDDRLYLKFHEIVNAPRKYKEGFEECSFDMNEFRPIDDRRTDISIFRGLLEPARQGARVP